MTSVRIPPLVFAHRGARDIAPENTLAAFRAAMDVRADGIELDVQRCASGEIVVMHDSKVDRCTDGTGLLRQMTWDELQRLDAGGWFNEAFRGERLPLFEQVLQLIAGKCLLNVEIKTSSVGTDGIEGEVVRLLREYAMENSTIISSFNPFALIRCKHLAPDIPRGILYSGDLAVPLRNLWLKGRIAPQALHPQYDLVDSEYMDKAKGEGLEVNVWTVDEIEDMKRMTQLGVHSIITDHPGLLVEKLAAEAF